MYKLVRNKINNGIKVIGKQKFDLSLEQQALKSKILYNDNNCNLQVLYDHLEQKINFFEEQSLYMEFLKSSLKTLENFTSQINSSSDPNFNKVVDVISKTPILAFDSEDEYENYMSYQDDTVKRSIIEMKVLTKMK